ncbi:HNH endonuclease signature motif containing protein [Mycobacterium sp. WMMD1722]|uniref:HNH endonuclease signature motif containing protein n=1 Tax=Mycobacterium sp. WMMD1722 TaxID=3404117 RepID=UPI003BF55106
MDREDLQSALERWDAARAELAAFPFYTLTTHEKLAMLEHVDHAQRQDLALSHNVTAAFLDDADPKVFGERSIPKVIATRLRISDADAGHRISDARDLGPRWTPTGEQLSPRLSETAAALARGDVGAKHVAEIQKALKKLPPWVGAATMVEAEQLLARLAVGMDPESLRKAAEHLLVLLDPDGDEPNDELHQRKRHLTTGRQQRDGMTPVHGLLDPETAALLDVVLAKHGKPGHNLPHDPAGLPDTRSQGQRHHDALKTGLRDLIGSGTLGQINGLPATIVATTTIDQLEQASGWADTASGTRLPVRDLIRMAGQARHYLAVFDHHHEEVLYLGRAKRCATTAQRLALFTRDKGCTRPSCTRSAFDTEVHHTTDYAKGGHTNIDQMALACKPDNLTIEDTDWTTRHHHGRTEWLPPPKLDTGQTRVNNYFHPQRYLEPVEDDDPE